MLPITGKTRELWLILTLPEKNSKLPLKLNISFQNISDFTLVTMLKPTSEIQLSVFPEMMKIAGSNMTSLKS